MLTCGASRERVAANGRPLGRGGVSQARRVAELGVQTGRPAAAALSAFFRMMIQCGHFF
jgi:hypothetical protein